ncbi:MAG: class I SAM-dependent methyltransferase [Thermodesulfobacteriota bacterium]
MNQNSYYRPSAKVFGERAAEYDSWYDDSLLFEIEKNGLLILDSPRQPSLEIGIGPGRFGELLSITFGLDPAHEPLLLAAQRGIPACRGIASELPFGDNSLGSIYLLFTLCFLERGNPVLNECHRVLRHDGRLIIGFIPATSSWGQNLEDKKKQGHPFYQYADFRNVFEVENDLADHGFSIVSRHSTLYQPPDKLSVLEKPQPGADESAGFVIIEARRNIP